MAVKINRHTEEYVTGLAGVNSCKCILSVKNGVLKLQFVESMFKIIDIELTANEVDFAIKDQTSVNATSIVGGAALGGFVFGSVGAILGGLGSMKNNYELGMKFVHNGFETVLRFKASMTSANLYNQLLLFKQENIDPKSLVVEPKNNKIILSGMRWFIGIVYILGNIIQPQIASVFLIPAGVFLLPITFPYIEKRFDTKISKATKHIIFWSLIIVGSVLHRPN
ncbi:MAG: hypothetical protein JNL70_21795 [Saprospiraceae bacterium]|nr:hypothetical protein [Saprospiraceae bacterium]